MIERKVIVLPITYVETWRHDPDWQHCPEFFDFILEYKECGFLVPHIGWVKIMFSDFIPMTDQDYIDRQPESSVVLD